MTTTTVSLREIVRNSKTVFERVKQTGQPAIVVSHKQPQVVIVRLEDFRELEQMRRRNSAKAALQFVKEIRELLQDESLPRDLSQKHDYYLWEEEPRSTDERRR